ncbi:MAG: ABC transporter ATP-binding protein [Pseudomonadota bacterium]
MNVGTATAMLTFDSVNKTFVSKNGVHQALSDIRATVFKREFVAVVGASGCGKSTLIRIAAGLESATGGRILVSDKEVREPGSDRGMVFQQFTLFPWLNVKENIMFGLQSQNHAAATCEQIASQWIDLVGLGNFANHYPSQLSGGMQQRVAIARALAPSPKVLLMDEPFAALDPHTRKRMQGYLLEIWQNMDITIMFVTHDLEEAVLLADRVLVLAPNPGHLVGSINIDVPRTEQGRDRYDPAFKQALEEIQALSRVSALEDEPPLDLFRLARVDDAG